MPKPKTLEGLSPTFVELTRHTIAHAETNDCAVKAIAAATDAPYTTVLNALYAAGRRPRRGTPMAATEQVMQQLGFRMVPVLMSHFIEQYPAPHHTLRSVTTHHPDRFRKVWADGQTYLLRTRSHILCVKNGVNLDWTRGKAKRAWRIYRVEKMA